MRTVQVVEWQGTKKHHVLVSLSASHGIHAVDRRQAQIDHCITLNLPTTLDLFKYVRRGAHAAPLESAQSGSRFQFEFEFEFDVDREKYANELSMASSAATHRAVV